MKELSRNQEQVAAMQIIYELLTYINMNEEFDYKEVVCNFFEEEDFEETPLFVRRVALSAVLHKDEAIEAYQKNMRKWKFSRLSRTMQSILLLSYAHFYYIKEVEKAVVINVAINLTKNYCDKDDYKFINAILENTLNE